MFAVAYVVAQLSRPLILVITLGPHPYRRLKVRMAWSSRRQRRVLARSARCCPPTGRWCSGRWRWSSSTWRPGVGWPVPGLGRSTVSKWEIAGEHLAERYQQFFLVALGETILVAGFAYSTGPFGSAHTWAFGARGGHLDAAVADLHPAGRADPGRGRRDGPASGQHRPLGGRHPPGDGGRRWSPPRSATS